MDHYKYRPPVISKSACVVSEQPLSCRIGYDILQKGGNAADAAIAMAFSIGFLCPNAAGLGGDCQILFYKAEKKSVNAINGSGRSAKGLTLGYVRDDVFSLQDCEDVFDMDLDTKDSNHGVFVTVPGFVLGMHQLYERFGSKKLKMEELMGPTVSLATEGGVLAKKSTLKMLATFTRIQNTTDLRDILGSKVPAPGQIIRSPTLVNNIKYIARVGPQGFYTGKIAQKIIQCVKAAGGALSMDDMKHHLDSANEVNARDAAVFKDFRGFRVWEMPPNTTGIIVLHALGLLEAVDLKVLGHNSAEYIQVVANAIREAVFRCWDYICDPQSLDNEFYETVLKGQEYKGNYDVARLSVDSVMTEMDGPADGDDRAEGEEGESEESSESEDSEDNESVMGGQSIKLTCDTAGDTSYITVVDKEGNACSLILSIFSNFGSKLVPEECGFLLHDRGKLFSLFEYSSNVLGSRKRPLHTLIPAMITDPASGELFASFGLTGGWMELQGHIQLLLNMIIFGMDPQMALDKPRFLIGNPALQTAFRQSLDMLNLEQGIEVRTASKLGNMGFNVIQIGGINRVIFGCGQIIAKPKLWVQELQGEVDKTLWAGSDTRGDGIAIGF